VGHSKVFRPPLRAPIIGDLVKLSGLGSLARPFRKHHGVGVVNSIGTPEGKRIQYQVKWLKSDELMTFHEEDLLIISNVHVDR